MPDTKTALPTVPAASGISLAVALAIPPACLDDLQADADLLAQITAAITSACAGVMADLGIPGEPAVKIQALDDYRSPYLARVHVNGYELRASAELLARVHSVVFGTPPTVTTPLHLLVTWLDAATAGQSAAFLAENRQALVAFLQWLCREMIAQQPSLLLGDAQLAAYRASLPPLPEEIKVDDWPPAPDDLAAILRPALDLHIGIGALQTVATTIGQSLAEGRASVDIAEDLIAALRSDVVEILIRRDDLRTLTLADTLEERNAFKLVRDGLFYELGMTFPDFRFVPADWLKPGHIAFRVNHLATLPFVSLQPDQRLVNARAGIVRTRGIAAQACANPVNWSETSIISAGDAGHVADLWVWDPIDEIALAFSGVLRDYSACFVDTASVAQQLASLEQIAPALVRAVDAAITPEQLARIERQLVAEGISLGDLRRILETLVDYDFIVSDVDNQIIFDSRIAFPETPSTAELEAPEKMAQFVRMGMKRMTSHKALADQHTTTLLCHLLEQDLATALDKTLRHGDIRSEVCATILDALEATFAVNPLPSPAPAILIGQNLRAPLHTITAIEFPRLRIWAFAELTAETQIQLVGQIATP